MLILVNIEKLLNSEEMALLDIAALTRRVITLPDGVAPSGNDHCVMLPPAVVLFIARAQPAFYILHRYRRCDTVIVNIVFPEQRISFLQK